MKNILKILVQIFSQKYFTGLLPDTRSEQKKNKDYAHEERIIETQVDPFGNQQITNSPYFYENQNQTNECVPHAIGLALAIERKNDHGEYIRLSPTFPYRLRSNYPQGGSIPQNIFDIYAKKGAPLFDTLSTPLSESEANSVVLTDRMYEEAKIFKGKEYFTLKTKFNDIEEIARIASLGHGVPITIFATQKEWSQIYPSILDENLNIKYAEVRHEVCVLPHSGFVKDGVAYVTVQDSAWFGGYRLRHISGDFIKQRCYGAGYWDTVEFVSGGEKPKHTFKTVLRYGMKGDEVLAMQKLLISEGLLPKDCATGNFFGRTLAAVNSFQSKYAVDILIPLGLQKPTGIWGNACIKKANLLCNN